MTRRAGRPRTFPAGLVPLAVERRERTGETWKEIARDLDVNAVTLRARAAEYRRQGVCKTGAAVLKDEGRGDGPTRRT